MYKVYKLTLFKNASWCNFIEAPHVRRAHPSIYLSTKAVDISLPSSWKQASIFGLPAKSSIPNFVSREAHQKFFRGIISQEDMEKDA